MSAALKAEKPWEAIDELRRATGIKGHADVHVQPEQCAARSVGRQCEWCNLRESAIEVALFGIHAELTQWPATWEHRCFSRWHAIGDSHESQQRQWQKGAVGRCTCGSFSLLNMPMMRSALVNQWWLWLHPDARRYWTTTGEVRITTRPGTRLERVGGE